MFGFKIVRTNLRSKLEEELKQARAERDYIIYHVQTPDKQKELQKAFFKIEFIKDILND